MDTIIITALFVDEANVQVYPRDCFATSTTLIGQIISFSSNGISLRLNSNQLLPQLIHFRRGTDARCWRRRRRR
jgi:hypothetical protein